MRNLNYKEGINRIYNVIWVLVALKITLEALGRIEKDTFGSVAAIVVAVVLPLIIKKVGIWVYQGFINK